jgi:ubiquitin-like protein Pup
MAQRVHAQPAQRSQRERDTEAAVEDAEQQRGEGLASEIDALLDEIDEVLEENATELVSSYVQRGGQ